MHYGDKLNSDEIIGSSFALTSLNNLNHSHLQSRLKYLGLNYNLDEINIIINKIIANLQTIQKTSITNHPENSYTPYFYNYKDLEEDKKTKKLVFSSAIESHVEICDLLVTSCYNKKLSIKKYSKLLEGRYSDNSENSYIFIGNKDEYLTGINTPEPKVERVLDIEYGTKLVLYGSSNSTAMINKKEKRIELSQGNVDDRFLIMGGELNDWIIKFTGQTNGKINSNQRFDSNLLTGCLTLIDLSVDNISIDVNDAFCEDGVNLIRTRGDISKIDAKNVLSDAIDADFSSLNFNYINVKNAGNDCVDLSSGDYKIDLANLTECKDKAISAGERSKLTINTVKISNSNLGLAAKDSSIIKVNSVDTNSTSTCLSAYNKKQEFWGGKILVKQHNCEPNQVLQEKNSLVEFI